MDRLIATLERNWNFYAAAYGVTDEAERGRLLNQSVSDDVIFTNPGGEGNGRAGLNVHIGNLQKSMPGARFSTDKLLVNHGELLAIWTLYKPDGAKLTTGYNFVRPDLDGRFNYMVGFF